MCAVTASSENTYALFVLAHQDDECFAAPWMRLEASRGNALACVYLTDGASRSDMHVRNAESVRVLEELGLSPADVLLADDRSARDGELVATLADSEKRLLRWVGARKITAVYSPDWEGGHQDHDAAHLIALRVAQRLGLLESAWGFSLYNAYKCPAPFFRVLNTLPGFTRRIRHTLRTGWRLSVICWRYPSQRRTWIGLFPGVAFARLIRRSESVRKAALERVTAKPHHGTLLYERLFGYSAEKFADVAQSYVATLLKDKEH